jgi:hypothetical protein
MYGLVLMGLNYLFPLSAVPISLQKVSGGKTGVSGFNTYSNYYLTLSC